MSEIAAITSKSWYVSAGDWVENNPVLVTAICLAIIGGMIGVIYSTDFTFASKVTVISVGAAFTITIPLLFLASGQKKLGPVAFFVLPTNGHAHAHCKHEVSSPQSEKMLMALKVLELISLVALAVIACYTNYKLFLPFFGAGILLGTYLFWKNDKKPTLISDDQNGGCSQGFLEQLTGVKLPPLIGLAINVAVTYEHILHHSKIFPPIIGLNAGVWVGKYLGYYIPKIMII